MSQGQTLKNSHTQRQEEEETLRDAEENHGSEAAWKPCEQTTSGRSGGGCGAGVPDASRTHQVRKVWKRAEDDVARA